MSVLSGLLRVGSIAQSMSVYLPAMLIQRTLGLGRVVLLTYLITKGQMGHWGLGVMIFTLAAPLVTLGSNHGLARYVSLYEARGQLRRLYRQAWLWVVVLAVVLSAAAMAASGPVVSAAVTLKGLFSAGAAQAEPIPGHMAPAIMGNVCLLAIYLNLMGFIYGLRAYRLASAVEVLFSILFTVGVLTWVVMAPTALTLLLVHMGALAVAVVFGGVLLRVGVGRFSLPDIHQAAATELAGPIPMEPSSEDDAVGAGVPRRAAHVADAPGEAADLRFTQVVKFGLVSMVGTLVWQGAMYVSYFMVYMYYGGRYAGPFLVFMQLSQPVVFLANASWAVLFSHVARQWESGDRTGAMFVLETSYKAISLTVMTLSIGLYITSPFWIRILNIQYQHGGAFLSGLLTFFVTVSNMTMLTVLAKLHKRPIVIALAALLAGALNVVLAALWMPSWGEVGAARAAGVGMYFGGGLVMLVYLLASGTRLRDSTYFVLGTPILLLLPIRIIGPLWAVLLPVCLFSPWIFDARQKNILLGSVRKGLDPLRRVMGRMAGRR